MRQTTDADYKVKGLAGNSTIQYTFTSNRCVVKSVRIIGNDRDVHISYVVIIYVLRSGSPNQITVHV